jgi:hypothetical protein
MLADFEIETAKDVYAENPVYNIPRDNQQTGLDLAVMAWWTKDSDLHAREAHAVVLGELLPHLFESLPGYSVWLLFGNSCDQEDNRIIRHFGLWKAVNGQDFVATAPRSIVENCLKTSGGVRFFAAVELNGDSPSPVRYLHNEPVATIVAIPRSAEAILSSLVNHGWTSARYGPSLEILATVCGADGIVLRQAGDFDERHCGIVLFGRPAILEIIPAS